MKIGIPKEIKDHEYRVSITPAGVQQLVQAGHEVIVQNGAGKGSSLHDEDYKRAGARLVKTAKQIFGSAEMIVKVKEPQASEYPLMKKDQIMFTYLHLAADKKLTQALMKQKVVSIGYETVQLKDGSLPLLTPMSEVAGRMAVHEGAKYLESARGGKGVLLSGVPGVRAGMVTILGGGVAGLNAAKVAAGLGARVNVLDISLPRLRYLDDVLPTVNTIRFTPLALQELLPTTDVLICTVLVKGAKAPKLVTRNMLKLLEKGSVIVDISIDQGGCTETSKATTHSEPTYIVDGIVHYCVANMPGAVAHTSTYALTNATFPYVMKIANQGWKSACEKDESLAKGVHTVNGLLTEEEVAKAFGFIYTPYEQAV